MSELPVTILATPKAFTGIFDVIQTNAVRSWASLCASEDVVLFGNDPGTAEICAELGLRHVPDVEVSERGTPLLCDILGRGQQLARHDVICFLNADIILTPTIRLAIDAARGWPGACLLTGRREDLDIDTLIDVKHDDWAGDLLARADTEGELKPPNWIDYFVFSRGLFDEVPPFAVGRPGYDNWMLWYARQRGAVVIDATPAVRVVHQRHDYSHAGGRLEVMLGAEAKANLDKIGGWNRFHSIDHATHVLAPGGRIEPANGVRYRLARGRRAVAHTLRFLRPLRLRILGERGTRRRGVAVVIARPRRGNRRGSGARTDARKM